jgi:predicted phage tail component-like protein
MALYNSGIKYNFPSNNGGGMYNSAPFLVIIYDSGIGSDIISNLLANIDVSEAGSGVESVQATVTLSLISDSGTGQDNVSLSASLSISDVGSGADSIASILCQLSITDSGSGQDAVEIAKAYFIIDSERYLQPLNVLVLQDSRYELFPSLKEFAETVPGKHGDIDFGNKLGSRILELHVATTEGLTEVQKETLKRDFAKYLDSSIGVKNLIFSDDIEKSYAVKYAGKINPKQYPEWFDFVIPFKMPDPYITGSYEHSKTGSGTITNSGNIETGLSIEISGPLTSPSITIGDETLIYTGIISTGQTLVIDTENMTAELDGVNVLNNLSGTLPLYLEPGGTSVTASGQVCFIWKDRWV